MYKEFFRNLGELSLPLGALGVFLVLFVAVVVRTFVLRRPSDFDNMAQMPLSSGEKNE